MGRFISTNKFLISAFFLISVFTNPEISHSLTSNLSTEKELKAAYLFNFLKFVEWNQEYDQNINDGIYVTIVGDEYLYNAFQPVQEKKVKGRNLVVAFAKKLDEVQPSHLIYISPDIMKKHKTLPDFISKSGALTVGESESFSKAGGIIGFIRSSDRIRFTISKIAANNANLEISSKLLQLGLVTN